MKVWLLFQFADSSSNDPSRFRGVFSTKELALAALDTEDFNEAEGYLVEDRGDTVDIVLQVRKSRFYVAQAFEINLDSRVSIDV